MMKARAVVLAAFAVCLAAGLAACGGSAKTPGNGVRTSGPGVAALKSALFGRGHRFTLSQVKAAFATQGIKLRTMRRLRGGRVIVLFDPRWHAPWGYHYIGKQPSATQFRVFVHANAGSGGYWLEDGNLWVDNGQGLGPTVDTALHKLDQSSEH
jgi:hypothetical protein